MGGRTPAMGRNQGRFRPPGQRALVLAARICPDWVFGSEFERRPERHPAFSPGGGRRASGNRLSRMLTPGAFGKSPRVRSGRFLVLQGLRS